jgi:tRNA U34 5-methylaminomethyl-2-thiouridine-forming methyltransferase MnmC
MVSVANLRHPIAKSTQCPIRTCPITETTAWCLADGSFTVWDNVAGACMHSTEGALAESLLVYREAVRLQERFANEQVVQVLEVGFGTGLNFVLAAQLAEEFPGTKLVFHSWEPFPLEPAAVQVYHKACGTAGPWANWAAQPNRETRSRNVVLQVHPEPWPPAVPVLLVYHAVYFDPYGPKSAPELWTEASVLASLGALHPELGIWATYSVTGTLKRLLRRESIPFAVLPGFGRKRERLIAGAI